MRKLMILSWMFILIFTFSLSHSTAQATTYTFTPTPIDMYDLDHSYAYSWQINWSLPAGQTITGASLSFSGIYDWTAESNILYLQLMDTTPSNGTDMTHGIIQYYDNQASGNYFSSSGIQLTSQSFTTTPVPYTYTFNSTQLNTLATYASDGKFYLGFDPDCHYYNSGITFTITTSQSVPEPSTFLFLGSGLLLGFVFLRKRVKQNI
jgi:hypothetical protein